MANNWYYRDAATLFGPFSASQMQHFAKTGRIGDDTPVRQGREGKWVAAGRVTGLLPSSAGRANATEVAEEPQATALDLAAAARLSSAPPSLPGSRKNPDSSRSLGLIVGSSLLGIAIIVSALILTRKDKATASDNADSNPLSNPQEIVATAPPGEARNAATVPASASSKTSADSESTKTARLGITEELPARPPELPSNIGRAVPSVNRPGQTTEDVVASSEAAVALLTGRIALGTGFLIQPNVLVTNRHVITTELIESLQVHFPSAPEKQRGPYAARLLYEDKSRDLAILRVDVPIKPLPLAVNYKFRRGQEIIVIGNPGVRGGPILQNAISKGVMSTETKLNEEPFYQLGIAINAGNSGGPVIDLQGRVVGVVTLKAVRQEGLGFCIPATLLQNSLDKMRQATDLDRQAMVSRHRAEAIFRHVQTLAAAYRTGMQATAEAMEQALRANRSPNAGLAAIRERIQLMLAGYDEAFVGNLKTEVSKISSDRQLQRNVRSKFVEHWSNYQELRSYVEDPRGNYESYRAKSLELSDRFDRVSESLGLLLGISDEQNHKP